ncbi:MAG TPA: UDP-N-acetylmuramoyl-tripeptide--D-alanyl-D-alanine ligase [Desulfobacteria bacterium]|nr:UDP-N-acetylmuramoyl-tripeptide--D-alanyl-D-alanine ligase [Desulfobacteria bacterium]
MSVITAGKLCEVVGGKWIRGDKKTRIKGLICRYTEAKPGQIYFDVRGGKGGDSNILGALKNGASAVVISKHKRRVPFEDETIPVIAVPNVWEAFWSTVRFYREMYDIPVVGVTGTSGKTTTTAMISAIFRRRWKVLKTVGNLNLPPFVPSQIMRLKWGYQAAVFEVGMNRPGQISKQSRAIRPKVGVITHIGTGHIEHLGSYENVILEKSGIMEGIPSDGCLVLNSDDSATKAIDLSGFTGKVLYYGLVNPADFMAQDLEFKENGTSFKVKINGKLQPIFIPTYGKHNVYNALAAIAVAQYYNFDAATIRQGLARYHKPHMRLQIDKGLNNSVLINDTYNANPDSIMAGLEVLATLAKGRNSVAVLGNMLEQGEFSAEHHRKVGEKVEQLKINWLITVGTLAKDIARGVKTKNMYIKSFNYTKEASKFLRENLPKNSVVLVKGSRGARMEWVVKGLLQKDE